MPLTLPNLDNRSFADLLAQTQSLIPRYAKTWTNHNPSDPGITLLELLVWLTEMVLYRLNQIHDHSYLNFLELLGVEPSGPLVEVKFNITASKNALSEDFCIDKGTRVAAVDSLTGEEIIFETLSPVRRDEGRWDEEESCWVFKAMAVNTIEVTDELIGISDGSPNQEFPIALKPIFLDREDESSGINPSVSIGGEEAWDFKIDLLDSGPDNKDFTVKQLAGLVRFGDGKHGKIPPKDSEIFCKYRKLGSMKGNVAKGAIEYCREIKFKGKINGKYPLYNPSIVTVFNENPATGGVDSAEGLNDLLEKGLRQIQERFRAVSEEDFEKLARKAVPGKLNRVRVVFDRNLEVPAESKDLQEAHVSLIVLPTIEYLLLNKQKYSCADLINAMEGHEAEILKHDIHRYLDERRLITTILHVAMPRFTEVRLDITVKAKPGVVITSRPGARIETLEYKIQKRIERFLDPYEGWEDDKGWPFGRDIYRSELYQQIESIEEVDYVEEMFMNGELENSSIAVAEYNLVCLISLDVRIT